MDIGSTGVFYNLYNHVLHQENPSCLVTTYLKWTIITLANQGKSVSPKQSIIRVTSCFRHAFEAKMSIRNKMPQSLEIRYNESWVYYN